MPSVSLIITTYNWPEALELSLKSVLRQTRRPNEVIIADDGSGIKTEMLVSKYSKILESHGIKLIHSWQPDDGFRLSRSRNLAMAKAKSDYIIFIDGDIIMERHFVEDHLIHAEEGYFVIGRRTKLSEKYSKMIAGTDIEPHPFCSGVERGREQSIRSKLLAKLCSKRNKSVDDIHGCNISFWRLDAFKVNGFNCEFVGWGAEDKEFFIRMINNGLTKKKAKFSAVAYHVYHVESSRAMKEANQRIFEETIATGSTWCRLGINQFLDVREFQPNTDKAA